MKDHGICTVAVQLPSKIETYVSVGYLKRNPEISTEGREELVIGLKFASTLGLEDGDVVGSMQCVNSCSRDSIHTVHAAGKRITS